MKRNVLISGLNQVSKSRARQALSAATWIALSAVAGSTANGATETWVGNTDANLSTAANWTGTNLPPITGDSLIFGTIGSAGSTLNNDLAAITLAGINFDAASGAYVINPAAVATNTIDFSLGAVISNNSAFLQTINTETAGSSSVTVSGTGDITFQRIRMAGQTNNTLTYNGSGILTLGTAGATTHNNNLALTMSSGTVALGMSGTNIALDRAVTINGGTLKNTGTSTNLISDQTVTMTAGTYDLNGVSDQIGALAGSAGTVTNSSATAATLSLGGSNTSGSFSGIIQNGAGTLAINKVSTGTITLGGTNSYSGGTALSGGILNIAAASAIGTGTVTVQGGGVDNTTGSPLTLSNNLVINGSGTYGGSENLTFAGTNTISTATLNLQLNGTTGKVIKLSTPLASTTGAAYSINVNPQNIGNSFNYSNSVLELSSVGISTGSNVTLTIGGGNSTNINSTLVSGVISDGTGTTNNLSLVNSGTVTLNGANTFTGTATVGSAGALHSQTVVLGNANALGSNTGTIVFNSSKLMANTNLTGANRIQRNVTFQGGVAVNPATGGVALIAGANAIEFSGNFTNNAGNRTLWVTNSAGTILSGNIFLSEVSGTGRTLSVLADGPVTFGGAIQNFNGSGAAGLLVLGGSGGTSTMSGANTYTGTTTLLGGSTVLDYSTQNNSKLSDVAALIVSGGHNLSLSGGSHAETILSTTLNSGAALNISRTSGTSTINLNALTNLGSTARTVNVQPSIATTDALNNATGIIGSSVTAGADWAINSTNAADGLITAYSAYQTGVESVWAATDNVSITADPALSTSTDRTINTLKTTSNFTIPTGRTLTLSAGGLLNTGAGARTISGGTIKGAQATTSELLVHQNSADPLTISSIIANGNGASQLTKSGDGVLILSGANTFTGTTNIIKGTLKLGATNTLNATANSGAGADVQISGGAKFDLNGFNQTLRNVNIVSNSGGTAEVTNSSGTLSTLQMNTTNTNGTSNMLYSGNLVLVVKNPGNQFQMSNPLNSLTGGVKIQGNGAAFAASQLNVAGGVTKTGLTTQVRGNAETAMGTGSITLDNGSITFPSNTNYIVGNNFLITSNGGEINSDNNNSAYTGSISTVSGTPLLALTASAARPNLRLTGSQSGFTGVFALDTVNANLFLTGNATGSSNADLSFFGNGSNGIVRWDGQTASPVTITYGEVFTQTGHTGTGQLTSNVAANVTYALGKASSTTATFSGVISNGSGTVNLTKSGTNTQVLSGANTYTGSTTINGGTLQITGSLAAGTSPVVNSTGTLAVGIPAGSGTVNGSVTVNSGGNVNNLSGGNIVGTTTVNGGGKLMGTTGTYGGTATLAGGSTAGTQATLDLINNSISTLNFSNALNIGGASAGEQTAMKFEVGDLSNNADLMNISGAFNVATGGAKISLINFGNLVGGGQIYTLANFGSGTGSGFATGTGSTVGSLALDPATINFGPLNASLIVNANSLQVQINGTIVTPTTAYWTGAVGDGVWNTFSGPNANFSTDAAGTTPISGFLASTTDVFFTRTSGTATQMTNSLGQNFNINSLTFTGTGTTAGTTPVVINGSAVGANTLTIAASSGTGITLNSGSAGATLNMTNLNLGASQTWTNNSSNDLTVNSAIAGSARLTINGSGSGKVILAGTNTYNGGTQVDGGKLQVNNSSALGTGDLQVNGGQLNLNGNSITTTSLSGTGGTILNNGTGTSTLTLSGGSGTYSGTLADNNNAGTGKLALSANGITLGSANTLTGGITSTGGTITQGVGGALGTSNIISMTGGGNVDLNGFNTTVAGLGGTSGSISSGSAATLNISGTSSSSFGGSIGGAVTLIKSGSGTQTFSGNNGYTGDTTLSGGAISLSNGVSSPFGTGIVTFSSSSATSPVLIINASNGTTPFINSNYIGNNVVVIAGTTNVISNSTSSFGNLWIGSDTTKWTGTGTVAIYDNGSPVVTAALWCNDVLSTFNGTIKLGSTVVANNRILNLMGSNGGGSFTSPATFDASGTAWDLGSLGYSDNRGVDSVTDLKMGSISGTNVLSTIQVNNTGTIEVGALNSSTSFAGVIRDANTGAGVITSLNKVGTGTLTLTNSQTYTGTTTVSAGKLKTVAALQKGAPVVLTGGGILEVPLNGTTSAVTSISSLTTTGTGSHLELHDNDLIINYGANPTVYTDTVNKVKAGLVLLGGTGTEGISSAEVDAQTVQGTILAVVDDGDANIGGAITATSGFTIPNPTGSVIVKFTWFGDSNLDGQVDGSDYALLDSGFTSGGSLGGWVFGDYDYSGTVDGSDYALIDTGFISQNAVLPEPTTLGLLGLGAMGMLRRRRA